MVVSADVTTENVKAGQFESFIFQHVLAADFESAMDIAASRSSEEGYYPVVALSENDIRHLLAEMKSVPLTPDSPYVDTRGL